MNPMVRRMIMIRVSGLLIEDMRTAVCIRFCVAAKEEGAGAVRGTEAVRGSGPGWERGGKGTGGVERAAGGNEASASCPEAGRERERAGVWEKEENEMQKMTKRKRK